MKRTYPEELRHQRLESIRAIVNENPDGIELKYLRGQLSYKIGVKRDKIGEYISTVKDAGYIKQVGSKVYPTILPRE